MSAARVEHDWGLRTWAFELLESEGESRGSGTGKYTWGKGSHTSGASDSPFALATESRAETIVFGMLFGAGREDEVVPRDSIDALPNSSVLLSYHG